MTRLKAELAKLKEKHQEEIKAFSQEQIRQEDESKTLRELMSKAEVTANSAKQEVEKLQSKIRVWQAEFAKVQSFMTGKLYFRYLFAPMYSLG